MHWAGQPVILKAILNRRDCLDLNRRNYWLSLGMIIAYLASMALPFSVRPDLMTVSLAIGISVFIGVVFSYFPASAASKRLDRYYEININSKETAILAVFSESRKIQRFQE